MIRYSPLNYYTYNINSYYASIGASAIFLLFYIILMVVFKYELYNKKEFCDPMFYYGQACRNKIANTVINNPGFMQAKQVFYATVKDTIDASGTMVVDEAQIVDASNMVQDNLSSNSNFINNTISQIQDTTSILKVIASKYLGNMQNLLNSTKNNSNDAWQQIQEIPQLLNNIQSQINKSIVTPALMPYTDPLKKLYKSLSDIQPPLSENEILH